jgi:nascent polypeptide-associated complex subunit alpha
MPEIEEVVDDDKKVDDVDDSDDDDVPELDDVGKDKEDGGKQNRGEKKCRKVVSKLGLKPVNGIIRITIRKSKNILFVISKPDVMKAPNSDTYIIFGEAKIEDMAQGAMQRAAAGGSSSAAQRKAAQQMASDPEQLKQMQEQLKSMDPEQLKKMGVDPAMLEKLQALAGSASAAASGKEPAGTTDASKDDGDMTFEENDIKIIMDHGVSREEAIAALKKNNNDVVEAIMSISS